ncbi:Type IV fimbrial biogenesis protein PilW [hydrothermal vent metagenome]|uniref:Type IV fimbrial biogenesis protein PilW n=1 Tax=hydrothermal vent metagenome TaxID=652676 RepID=A0A3B1B3Q1_9ZZZZ
MMNLKHSQQRGLTLIELMVALVISLLILAGLFTVYQSNQRGYQLNDGLTRTQENGRFAIDFLSRDIRVAAYPGNNVQIKSVLFNGSQNNVVDSNNHPSPSDTFVLRHGATGLLTADCAGNTPGNVDTANSMPNTTLNQYDIRNTVRINNRCRPIYALFCNGNELVEGIENMQVLYGVDTDYTPNFITNQYFTSDLVPNGDWSKIVSLRIALLASSVDERASAPSAKTFNLLGTTLGPYNGTTTGIPADQKIRRVYTTTILIRNNIVQ